MFKEYFKEWSKVIDFTILEEIIKKLDILYNHNLITPSKDKVFKCFTECSYNDLKVIIIGQDPYPQLNVATGLAFANKEKTTNISPSLQIIKESLITPYISNGDKRFDITLESWANQGILLLNAALTVEYRRPESHIDLWRPFIVKLIENLSIKNSGLVYILLGATAKTFKPYIDTNYNFVLYDNHPSFYARTYKEMSNRVFIETNKYLKGHYNTEIKWTT